MTVPIETSGRREAGVLRRFRATPLRPLTYVIGDVLVYFAMIMLGILLLFLLGRTAGTGPKRAASTSVNVRRRL